MAVTVNDPNVQVSGGYSLYTGLYNLNVLAINPTKEQLEVMGYKPKEEPQYTNLPLKTKDANGEEVEQIRNKITIYLGNDKIKTKFDFFVYPQNDIASTGTQRIINNLGQFTYSKTGVEGIMNNPNMSWFKTESARQALLGECQIIDFLREWLNVSGDGECSLDNPAKVCGGNAEELQNYAKNFGNHQVTCLLGVKEGVDKNGKKTYYQTVYNKCFSRPTYKNAANKFTKALNEKFGEFKDNFQGSLLPQEFIIPVDIDKPDQENKETKTDWS